MRVYDHFPNPDCKGYTLLNVHGYHGSPKNSAYTALHEIGCENIILPSIDYDSEEPSNVIGNLQYASCAVQSGYDRWHKSGRILCGCAVCTS